MNEVLLASLVGLATRSSAMASRTIIGNLSGYVEFYDAVSTGQHQPWIGTLDTGLIYQVTPNFPSTWIRSSASIAALPITMSL